MNEITVSPVTVNAVGTTGSARSLNVVSQACNTTRMMLVEAKGKVGQAARAGMGLVGAAQCAMAASQGNYLPLAQFWAAKLGESIFITGRSTYEALPDILDAKIAAVKATKSGGMREKDGVLVPGSKLVLLETLRADVVGIQTAAREFVEQRKAAGAQVQIGNTVEA